MGLRLWCCHCNQEGVKSAAEAAEAIGIGLQSFCIPGFCC